MSKREELLEALRGAESAKFINDMCDHWSKANYEIDDRLTQKIRDLKKELADLEEK